MKISFQINQLKQFNYSGYFEIDHNFSLRFMSYLRIGNY